MRRRLARRSGLLIAAILVTFGSGLLLGYAWWLKGIDDADRALAAGDTVTAHRAFDAAFRRAAFVPSPERILPDGYRQLVFNLARTMYAEQRDDALVRVLETEAVRSPQIGNDSEYHYWLGNVQFRKAMAQHEKALAQSGLQQAAETYRRALAASPDDWDIKYNYELATRLLETLRKSKEDNLEKMKRGSMKLLREDDEKKQEQHRQIAPEKRG